MQKAIRMLNIGMNGLVCNSIKFNDLEKELREPTDKRMYAIAEAIKKGYSVERINELTHIDLWFLGKIKRIVEFENELKKGITREKLIRAKKLGFSDLQIAICSGKKEDEIRTIRRSLGIRPFVKQIDTLAAEYPAKTNYLYMTYNGQEDDLKFNQKKNVIVLGGGPYKIGSSVEFDWCCVNSVITLKKLKYKTIMINCNPETVSTDYDICDRLYFDELSFENISEIYEKENSRGIIISMGGQIPNNLALKFHKNRIRVLGTSPVSIDIAEDRNKFSKLLDELEIDQPEWQELAKIEDAKLFARKAGYPVLIRPSYVLSGAAMSVAGNDIELVDYLKKASDVSQEHPVVISKFITNAKEIEIDAVAKNGNIIAYAISEHLENAGVHSGDATMLLPPQKTYLATVRKIKKAAKSIAKSLYITGPFNIQFIAKENQIKVIECNLRASRSFPFASKVFKVNFIDLATRAMMNSSLPEISKSIFEIDYVGVKAPQFSFSRLKGADPILGVEMASTGEVACLGDTVSEAFLKAMISAGFKIPRKNILISVSGDKNKFEILESVRRLYENGYNIYTTEHTEKFYERYGVITKLLYKIHEKKEPNIITYLKNRKIDMVISMPEFRTQKMKEDTYIIRRLAVDFSIPLVNDCQIANLLVYGILKKNNELKIKSWDEYK